MPDSRRLRKSICAACFRTFCQYPIRSIFLGSQTRPGTYPEFMKAAADDKDIDIGEGLARVNYYPTMEAGLEHKSSRWPAHWRPVAINWIALMTPTDGEPPLLVEETLALDVLLLEGNRALERMVTFTQPLPLTCHRDQARFNSIRYPVARPWRQAVGRAKSIGHLAGSRPPNRPMPDSGKSKSRSRRRRTSWIAGSG